MFIHRNIIRRKTLQHIKSSRLTFHQWGTSGRQAVLRSGPLAVARRASEVKTSSSGLSERLSCERSCCSACRSGGRTGWSWTCSCGRYTGAAAARRSPSGKNTSWSPLAGTLLHSSWVQTEAILRRATETASDMDPVWLEASADPHDTVGYKTSKMMNGWTIHWTGSFS